MAKKKDVNAVELGKEDLVKIIDISISVAERLERIEFEVKGVRHGDCIWI